MQQAIALVHQGLTLRGMEHIPDGASTPVPAAILFHGFTGTKLEPHRMFLKISRALEQRGIASFRFDFSGSGESDGDFEQMTLSGEVAEANAILDYVLAHPQVNPRSVSLIGLSMGGLVATLVSARRPQDIARLVLLAPAGSMPEFVRQMAASPGVDVSRGVFDHGGNLVGLAFAEDIMTVEPFEQAKGYPGPVLLVHGTADETIPCTVSGRYRAEVYGDQAELHLIDGADHTFNRYEWEQELIQAVTSFLARA
ncbi:alpha/beta hydrolase [Alicyclobacillus contaminans]|uniref:alpha/beta hydrolase n=1 Tax=Alicyclobacillus contaminans TaxID=392016 RepID=UPI0004219709|nr:alpha/beta fold hydrolase [Alicyclobacillus contaminans]GMA51277.1 alpha/beta hydrolase [Alicyclobacillus contaminans]